MNQEVKLNLIPRGTNPRVYASQYDVGRTITLAIYDGDEPYIIPDGTTVEILGTKPDDKAISEPATYSGSKVSFATTEQMTAVEGITNCECTLLMAGVTLGSLNFELVVEPSATKKDADFSESELSTIEQAIRALNTAAKEAKAAAKQAVDATSAFNLGSTNLDEIGSDDGLTGAIYTVFGNTKINKASVTIKPYQWSGTEAPYTADLGNATDGNPFGDKFCYILLDTSDLTEDQVNDISNYGITTDTNGEGNSLIATQELPTINVPLIIYYREFA